MGSAEYALAPPFSLVVRACVDSTNDEMKRLAAAGAPPFTVVWAETQNGGRGRLGRPWVSPSGNLYCSMLLDPGDDVARAPQLSFVAAVAVTETLADLAPGVPFSVKWPNDVLCQGRKICGMLLERAGASVVMGIGINVVSAPELALYPAACLARVGSRASAFDVLVVLCDRLAIWLERWKSKGFQSVRTSWLAHAAGVGEAITVRLADTTTLQGRFYGLDAEGGLLLDTPDGARQRILAGDVFFTP